MTKSHGPKLGKSAPDVAESTKITTINPNAGSQRYRFSFKVNMAGIVTSSKRLISSNFRNPIDKVSLPFVRTLLKVSGLFIAVAVLMTGCNLPASTTPAPALVFPTEPPTVAASPTALPASPTPPLPTATTVPAASATFGQGATRLRFSAGTTLGSEQGQIGPGQTQSYLVGASKGQPMIVIVGSPNNDVTESITAQSGDVLLSSTNNWSNWQGTLPATQDYLIQLYGGATTESYTLSVEIPSRITFPANATSVNVQGTTVSGTAVSYTLYALASQTMSINLEAPQGTAALSVYGFADGQPLLRSAAGSMTFQNKLPASQDYIIKVVPQAGQSMNYSLAITVK